ncbi:MAG: hypothetical protein ACRDYF_17350 [Acidimicrobiia bacterium]
MTDTTSGHGTVVSFWNRLSIALAERQAMWLSGHGSCGCSPWEVLLFAEVTRQAKEIFCDVLQPASVSWWGDDADAPAGPRAHGVMIVSRTGQLTDPVRPTSPPAEVPALPSPLLELAGPEAALPRRPRPERWRSVRLGGTRFVVFHAPYAAGSDVAEKLSNRLHKRRAYLDLMAFLVECLKAGERVVLGLDGNNWTDFLEGGEPPPGRNRRYRNRLLRILDHETDLFDAELAFHGPTPPHGLIDTLRRAHHLGRYDDPHGSRDAAAQFGEPLAVTHRLTHAVHRMDRIYASPEIPILRAGVCHGSMTRDDVMRPGRHHLAPGSDHALVWAELDLTRPSRRRG